jgi:hypothetical protein
VAAVLAVFAVVVVLRQRVFETQYQDYSGERENDGRGNVEHSKALRGQDEHEALDTKEDMALEGGRAGNFGGGCFGFVVAMRADSRGFSATRLAAATRVMMVVVAAA